MSKDYVYREAKESRLDRFLVSVLPEFSRSQIKSFVLDNCITINGVPACKVSLLLQDGDEVSFKQKTYAPKAPNNLYPYKMSLDIVHEDQHILVINKPTNLIVHPGASREDQITLVHGLLAHVPTLLHEFSNEEHGIRPGIVHRLDKDTSGLMVCAKTKRAHAALSMQFQDRSCSRTYKALLDGVIDEERTVKTFIERHPKDRKRFWAVAIPGNPLERQALEGRKHTKIATSVFDPVDSFAGRLTLCDVKLETGRTHQIRVHANYLQRWIVGDPVYGRKLTGVHMLSSAAQSLLKAQSKQLLHAYRLRFTHPASGDSMAFESPLPEDFCKIVSQLYEDFKPNS